VSEGDALADGIVKDRMNELFLMAHHNSQTFMHQQAVDISDFAKNVSFRCEKTLNEMQIYGVGPDSAVSSLMGRLRAISKCCSNLELAFDEYVIASSRSGAEYQFSTGVSMFLPWTRLAFGLVKAIYIEQGFSQTVGVAWFDFIDDYSLSTIRNSELPGSEMPFSASPSGLHREYIGREYIGKEYIGREHEAREVVGRDVSGKEFISNEFIGRERTERYEYWCDGLEKTKLENFYASFGRTRNFSTRPEPYLRTK